MNLYICTDVLDALIDTDPSTYVGRLLFSWAVIVRVVIVGFLLFGAPRENGFNSFRDLFKRPL